MFLVLEFPSGSIQDVSRSVCEQFGQSRSAMIAQSFSEYVPQTTWIAILESFEQLQRRGKDSEVLTVDLSPNGTGNLQAQVEVRRFHIGATELGMLTLRGILSDDIHDRQAISEAHEYIEDAIASPDVLFLTLDAQGCVTRANRATCELTGYSPEELRGMDWFDRIVPRERYPWVWEAFLLLKQKSPEAPRAMENPVISKSGEVRMVSWWNSPVLGPGASTISIGVDVTERKRVAEALRQSEQRFRTAFEHAAVGMALSDSETRIELANPALCEMLGYSEQELAGKRLASAALTPIDNLAEGQKLAGKLLSGELSRASWEKCYLHRDGHVVCVQVVAAVVRDSSGRPLHFITQIQDISERKRVEEALRQSEERYRRFVQMTDEAVWRTDFLPPISVGLPEREQVAMLYRNGYIGECNDAFARSLGYERADEVLGRPLTTLTEGPDAEAAAHQMRFIQSGYRHTTWEQKVTGADGRVFWIRTSAVGVAENGVLKYLWERAQDITERKHAKDALRESEHKYRVLFEGANDAINLCDGGLFIDCNPQATALFGYSRSEMVGRSIFDVSPQKQPDGNNSAPCYSALIQAALDGTPQRFSWQYVRKDGTTFDAEVSISRVSLNEKGLVIGIVRDVTASKQAADALRQTNFTLEALFRASPVAIVSLDPEGKVTLWNQAAERMFGWTAREALGAPHPIIPKESHAEHRELLAQVLRGEVFAQREFRRIRKDGRYIDVSVSVAPLRAANGLITGVLVVYADITEHKELQAELATAQKLETVGRLAGGVAHDFNNLLTVINGYGNLLLHQVDPMDSIYGSLQQIRNAGERATELTRQLLAFSRRQVLQFKVLDLNQVVREIEVMLQRLIGEDVQLVTELGRDLWSVKADPNQLHQVIMNLAVNARDAMPHGGKLIIRTENVRTESNGEGAVPGESVMLAVSDTGIGMDMETQAHVFEPFFTTKEQGKGTGLGLSTVWGIVKQSGGSVSLQSEPGKGTAFRVFLPREQALSVQQAAPACQPVQGGTETVLLIEDQHDVRDLVAHILRGLGYAVIEAPNGDKAIEMCEQAQQRIDVVLTDIVMPGITGRALVDRLKALRPEAKLLLMSGYSDDVIGRQGLLESGASYLEKPFTPETLAAKIREVLQHPPGGLVAA